MLWPARNTELLKESYGTNWSGNSSDPYGGNRFVCDSASSGNRSFEHRQRTRVSDRRWHGRRFPVPQEVRRAMRQFLFLLLALTAGAGSIYAAANAVPEVDPSSIGSALALAVGGGLIVVARYRRKNSDGSFRKRSK